MKQILIKEKPGFAYWIKTQTDSALRESITESFQAGRMLQPGCSATGRGPEGRGCREKGQIILFFSSHQTYSGLFCMTLSPIHGAHVANMYEGKKHARRCHPTSSLSRTAPTMTGSWVRVGVGIVGGRRGSHGRARKIPLPLGLQMHKTPVLPSPNLDPSSPTEDFFFNITQ